MRVLMIADASFALREQRMLTRLEIAQADEGVRVARAVPEGFGGEGSESFAPVVEYEGRSPLISTSARAGRLLERLGSSSPDWTSAALDAVHVWGEKAWALASHVAKLGECPLVVEMWSHRLLGSVRRFERRAARNGLVWIAPGDHTAEALREAGARERCRVASWGAHAGEKPAAFSDPVRPVSASVLATGRNPGAVSAALEGLALAARRHEELMIFLDAVAVKRSPEVWRRLRTLRAMDRVSLMPDLESRREAALHADFFVRPEASAEHRSVLLDAMAAGMCVLTARDPVVEALQHERTCLECAEGTALGWERVALRALEEPQRARAVGSGAQKWIRESQSVSAQASALMDAYEQLVGSPR